MSEKYLSAATSPRTSLTTIITNDLFLAAFLASTGCTLDRVEKNDRRRVSFVFSGERVRELREAYRAGPVRVDIALFRDNLNKLRDRLNETVSRPIPEERGVTHGSARLSTETRGPLQAVAQR